MIVSLLENVFEYIFYLLDDTLAKFKPGYPVYQQHNIIYYIRAVHTQKALLIHFERETHHSILSGTTWHVYLGRYRPYSL